MEFEGQDAHTETLLFSENAEEFGLFEGLVESTRVEGWIGVRLQTKSKGECGQTKVWGRESIDDKTKGDDI